MKFTDIFDIKEIQKIQDAFAISIGVASIITEPDGTPITKPSNFCRLCNDIIHKTPKGLANCMKSDATIGKPNAHGPLMQPCLSGGLWDGGAAIHAGYEHIANWLIGQVRNEELDDDQIIKYADEIGANKAEFKKALSEVTQMSKEQFANACNSLFLFSNQLSKLAYQNLQLRESREVLKKFNLELERRVKVRTIKLDQANKELEIALEELTEAFENIKTLKGLLPICSKCKKIRDDKGYWNQMEKYLEENTDALFSHSVCPDCAKKLYEDEKWYKNVKKKI